MTPQSQVDALAHELEAVLNRFREEFDIPYASAIGVLETLKFDLLEEMLEDEQ